MTNKKTDIPETVIASVTYNYSEVFCTGPQLNNQIFYLLALYDSIKGTLKTISNSKNTPTENDDIMSEIYSEIIECIELYDTMRIKKVSNYKQIIPHLSNARGLIQEILINCGFMDDSQQLISFTDLMNRGTKNENNTSNE